MKRVMIALFLMGLCFVLSAEIVGEISTIKETAPGIINVKVQWKNDGVLVKEETYTIADSDTAQAKFQNNVLPQERQKIESELAVKYELKDGKYIEKVAEAEEPVIKVYDIKIGDKVEKEK